MDMDLFLFPTRQLFYLAIQLQKTFSFSFWKSPCISFPRPVCRICMTGIHFIYSVTVISMATVFISSQQCTEVKRIVTSLKTGIQFQEGIGIILFTTMSQSAMRCTKPPIKWALAALSLGVKQPHISIQCQCIQPYLHASYIPYWHSALVQRQSDLTSTPYNNQTVSVFS